jgi:hypothetical protein
MRARWMALHESLVRSITTLKADQQFKTAGKVEKVLERFDADTLVAHLTAKAGDRDEKDRIYGALVRAVQSRSDWADLATALLWLGLWPGLDAIYGHRLRDFIGRPDELVTEISFIFTTTVGRIDLAGVNRLAATLIWNVERDVREGLKRGWADGARTADITAIEDDLRDEKPALDDRELPVDANDLPAVREWLTGIVQGDADLVIGAALYGFDLHELADELGISHEAARKRFQRAIKRIREDAWAKR